MRTDVRRLVDKNQNIHRKFISATYFPANSSVFCSDWKQTLQHRNDFQPLELWQIHPIPNPSELWNATWEVYEFETNEPRSWIKFLVNIIKLYVGTRIMKQKNYNFFHLSIFLFRASYTHTQKRTISFITYKNVKHAKTTQ